jgi:hypothetical protein
MHQTGAAARILTRVLFGFSPAPVRPTRRRSAAGGPLAEGYGFSLTFLHRGSA